MIPKIKTQFILKDKILFEIEGYLYESKADSIFNNDFMLNPKKYKIKKIEDSINSLTICRKVFIKSYKKSTFKKR